MASPIVLDSAALVDPIPGDDPAGTRFDHVLRQKLDSLRKEFEPNPDSPELPPVAKKADWQGILRLGTEALRRTSKDLEIAFRVAEAAVKLHGFAGLRDGLHLLHELTAQCWDRLHPIPDDGEGMEARAERFYWITEPDKGARFPHTVLSAPLLKMNGQLWSYLDLQAEMKKQGADVASLVSQAEPAGPHTAEDLSQCVEELNRLDALLTEKCAPHPPGWTGLRHALDECVRYIQRVAKVPVAAETAVEDQASGNGAMTGAATLGTGGKLPSVATREEAYRHLAHIANMLEQLEPHSPIPDLLRRAIELGRMPFRQLVQELIREPNLLAEIRREFGIRQPESGENGS